MVDLTLHHVLPDEWEQHRALRLEMLRDAPDAFWTTLEEATALDEATWRARITSAFHVRARIGDDPVGSVGLWDGFEPDPEEANLIAMYVAPRARGQQVGERLVRAVLEEAGRRGLYRVVLQVASNNAPAIGLYNRMGFALTGGSTPHPRRADVVELEMVTQLDAPAPPPARTRPEGHRQMKIGRHGVTASRIGGRRARLAAMTDVDVRPLGEEDWQQFKAIRLEALVESPEAFVADAEEEQDFTEAFWRERMQRSTRLVAERAGATVGVVSVGEGKGDDGKVAEIFGLWVRPDARGTGVATRLVEASAARARQDGRTHVAYWVGTDNGRAVAFASGIGFRPTSDRRPMRVASEEDGEEEIAMILPLGEDRGWNVSP